LLLSGVLAGAQAAELAEPVVRSHIGQPLVADIELSALADEAAPVQVRLASPDVYRGAGIGMHPVLSSLNMTVMRRDGRQYLHITSLKPLDAEYVHLFLELSDGSRRNLRGTTLWLTPDPNPAPPPPVAAAPAAPPAPVPAPSGQALEAAIARAAMAAPPLRAAAPARAACPQPYSAEQIRTCAALDYKNAALTAQIVELEEKVRLLQLAVDGKAEHPAPPAVPKKAAPKVALPPKPVAPPVRKTPWLPIGLGVAALLAAGGAGVVILRKKRSAKAKAKPAAPDEPPRPSFIASVKNRLMPGKGEAAPAAVEPSVG
jgi:pilus assembly protein FimV